MEYKVVFYNEDMDVIVPFTSYESTIYTDGGNMHHVAGNLARMFLNMRSKNTPAYLEVQELGTGKVMSMWTITIRTRAQSPFRTSEYTTELARGLAIAEVPKKDEPYVDWRVVLRRV